MANPFLVLGGVAVGVITAGIGVLQVPGWIDSANDSAVQNDLAQIALSQEAAYTVAATYLTEAELTDGKIATGPSAGEQTGVKFQPSSGVETTIFLDTAKDSWVAVGVSKSGHVMVRTSDATTVYKTVEKPGGAALTSDNFKAGGKEDGAAYDGPAVEIDATGAITVEGYTAG